MNHSAVAGGRSFGAIRGFLAIAGATMRCASAVESGHIPTPRDLKALGITQPLPGGQLLGR
jgi:hypothetical protein